VSSRLPRLVLADVREAHHQRQVVPVEVANPERLAIDIVKEGSFTAHMAAEGDRLRRISPGDSGGTEHHGHRGDDNDRQLRGRGG
jgi:hypothetical protein